MVAAHQKGDVLRLQRLRLMVAAGPADIQPAPGRLPKQLSDAPGKMIGQQGAGFGGARDRIGVEMADMERGTGRLTVYVQRLAAAFVNLRAADGVEADGVAVENARRAAAVFRLQRRAGKQVVAGGNHARAGAVVGAEEIGRASCRERVWGSGGGGGGKEQ